MTDDLDIPRSRGLSKDEQETCVLRTRTEEWTYIETTIPTDISELRRHPGADEVDSGYYGSTAWARFRVRADMWSPARAIRRPRGPMSAERKAKASESLKKARASR